MLQKVVFKVGGSLFDLSDLTVRLERTRSLRDDSICLLVPGGGTATECIREWDDTFALGEEVSHRLAMRSLDVTTDLLGELLPNSVICETLDSITTAGHSNGYSIIRPRCVLAEAEQQSHIPLPHSWGVSSDSIAAWVALQFGIEELILVKSAPMPPSEFNKGVLAAGHAAQAGIVDQCFPDLASGLPRVTWCNLRSEPITMETWFTNSP